MAKLQNRRPVKTPKRQNQLNLIIAGTLAEFPSKNPFRRATHAGTKHRIRLRTEILGIGVCGLGKV